MPIAIAVWLVLGFGSAVLWPGLSRRIGAGLMADPGLTLLDPTADVRGDQIQAKG